MFSLLGAQTEKQKHAVNIARAIPLARFQRQKHASDQIIQPIAEARRSLNATSPLAVGLYST
jgi:hypothetical protein